MNKPSYAALKILFTAFSIGDASEEQAGYEFIKRHGATDISALYWGDDEYAKKIPEDVKKIRIEGNNNFDPEITKGYDVVFRHQTTRPDLVLSRTTTNTNEFFKFCGAPIIGVTGTKGKGTTSTLISEILDQAGVENRLLGNIGNAALGNLDGLNDDQVVIFEISSFQLWDLEYSPHVAVVLMMGPDHLDVHNSIDEYIGAKANIVKHQIKNDVVIYHPKNKMTSQVVGSPIARSRRFMHEEGAHIVDGMIVIDGKDVMKVEDVGLRGEHNLENVTAAITAAWEFTQDVDAISKAVADFAGLEHRLEFVVEKDGVEFYNDSFSAVPVATVAAVKAFDKPVVLIAGGYDRGLEFDEMSEAIANSSVEKVFAIGDTRQALADNLAEHGFEATELVDAKEMRDVVVAAMQHVRPESVLLLSPGSASFDMFKSYKDRGNKFKEAVAEL